MLKGSNAIPEFTIQPQKTTTLCFLDIRNFAAVKRNFNNINKERKVKWKR